MNSIETLRYFTRELEAFVADSRATDDDLLTAVNRLRDAQQRARIYDYRGDDAILASEAWNAANAAMAKANGRRSDIMRLQGI
jgi:hypothetical protein